MIEPGSPQRGTQQAAQNTDRELWREKPDDYYSNSIHVNAGGGVGINVGGTVHVRTLKHWHTLAEMERAGLSTQSEATSHVYRARCQNPCILDGAKLLGTFVYDPTNGPVRFERAIDSKERAQGTSEDERALAAAIVEIVFNELDRDCNWLTGEDHAIGLVQKRLMRARASSLPKESTK